MSRDTAGSNNVDWSAATVETQPRKVKVVHSARIPADLSEKLEAEAARRGITPSALICELVAAGLAEVDNDAPVPIRPSQLHRMVDAVLRGAA